VDQSKLSDANSYESVPRRRPRIGLIIAVVVGGLLVLSSWATLLPRGQGGNPGGGPAQSEMYRIGYSYAESRAVKVAGEQDSYQVCNQLAMGFYYEEGQLHSQEEMDEWLQGCLAFVRN
jgi:hypothetical protein